MDKDLKFHIKNVEKTKIKLVGKDGNIFNLVGLAAKALRRDGKPEHAEVLLKEVWNCGSYDEALQTIMEYCDVS